MHFLYQDRRCRISKIGNKQLFLITVYGKKLAKETQKIVNGIYSSKKCLPFTALVAGDEFTCCLPRKHLAKLSKLIPKLRDIRK